MRALNVSQSAVLHIICYSFFLRRPPSLVSQSDRSLWEQAWQRNGSFTWTCCVRPSFPMQCTCKHTSPPCKSQKRAIIHEQLMKVILQIKSHKPACDQASCYLTARNGNGTHRENRIAVGRTARGIRSFEVQVQRIERGRQQLG